MAHHSTVFVQLLKLLPRHEFESIASRHQSSRKLRSMTRWDQILALAVAQLTRRTSLRDLVANFNAQASKLYHLGSRVLTRSTLARANSDRPAALFEEVFHKLLIRTRAVAPKHRFRFKGQLISIDASLVELTASVFPWAKYQTRKGALKLHVGLDHGGNLPALATITEGRTHEIHWAKTLEFPAGSVVVFDRGFFSNDLFNRMQNQDIRFVTRLKRGLPYSVLERRFVAASSPITSDQIIRLRGDQADRFDLLLRRVGYRDPESGKHYVFLTNALKLAASTIARIYKDRWQVELFFKWIKQNLRIKSFLGTSKNAVLSQIWVALTVYLLLAYLKFLSRVRWSMTEILRLLQLNLFERRSLEELLRPPRCPEREMPIQLSLATA